VEDGLSISDASSKYGIKGGHTVKDWVIKFGRNHLLNKVVRIEMKDEKDRLKELEKELKLTKEALADSVLAQRLLENLITLADRDLNTDIKKNFGSKVLKQKR
jgi:transposase-like protein